MQFTDIQDHEPIRRAGYLAYSHLIKIKESLKTEDYGTAGDRVNEALNQLQIVTQYLQQCYSIPQLRLPNHEPVLMWLDRSTLARLQTLQHASGYSMRQVIIDLLQSGELGEEYRRDAAGSDE